VGAGRQRLEHSYPSMMTALRCTSDQKEGRGGTRELGWPGFALAMAAATKVSGGVFLGASRGSPR
jgi:hypothetical protein